MSTGPQLSFAMQRMVCFALLFGMVMFTIAVAVMLQVNDGKGLLQPPLLELNIPVIATGIAAAATALLLRSTLGRRAEATPKEQRAAARFRATLVPLALLEGACMFALVAWLMNGNPVPNLVVGLGVMSVALAIVPMQDPDQERAG